MQEVNYQLFTDSVKDEIVLTSNIKDDYVLDNWLKDMELKNISDRNPHTLSGGQKTESNYLIRFTIRQENSIFR